MENSRNRLLHQALTNYLDEAINKIEDRELAIEIRILIRLINEKRIELDELMEPKEYIRRYFNSNPMLKISPSELKDALEMAIDKRVVVGAYKSTLINTVHGAIIALLKENYIIKTFLPNDANPVYCYNMDRLINKGIK